MTLLSLFQTLGAVAGFGSFAFLAWDRWFSKRPFVVLVAHAEPTWFNRCLYIRVHNPTAYPLLFSSTSARGEFSIMRDDSIESAVRYSMGGTTSFTVDANSTKLLPMGGPASAGELPQDQPYSVTIHWRRAQSPNWRWLRGRLKVETTGKLAGDLLKERHTFTDEE